jgi:hypothetical protein
MLCVLSFHSERHAPLSRKRHDAIESGDRQTPYSCTYDVDSNHAVSSSLLSFPTLVFSDLVLSDLLLRDCGGLSLGAADDLIDLLGTVDDA